MEVEVVTREVGEPAGSEPDPVGAAQFERVAGDFHNGGVDAPLGHYRQQCLQGRGFRGGQRAGDVGPGDPDADGADQAGGSLGRLQTGLDQVSRSGLARRPGDAEDHHPVGRVAVDRCRQFTEHRAGCRMHQDRDGRGLAEPAIDDGEAFGVGEHRDGATLDGGVGVLGSVQ
jgi:hypothetical protein